MAIELEISADFRQAQSAMNNFAGQYTQFGQKVKASSEKSSLAIFLARDAVLDLGHVARDIPFAANNIAILAGPIGKIASLFNTLKQETGSLGGAFGAMGAALSGGGGLVIGFELVTSALALFGGSLFGAGEKAETANTKFKEVKDTIESIAAQQASTSIAEVEKYSIALTDLNVKTSQRKAALEEYNKVAATSNQLQESDLDNIGKINKAINDQIELLKIRALIKGGEDKLAEAFKTIFNAQFKITDALHKANPTLKDAAEFFGNAPKDAKELTTNLDFSQNLNATKQLGFSMFRTLQTTKGVGEEVRSLTQFLDSLIVRADQFGGAFDGAKKKAEKIKDIPDILPRPFKNIPLLLDPDELFKDSGPQEIKASKALTDFFERSFSHEPVKPHVNIAPDIDISGDATKQAAFLKKVDDFNKQITEIFQNGARELGASLGKGLGDLLSGKGFGSLFVGIVNTMGDVLEALGEQLIKTAVAVIAFKDAFKALLENPVAAVAVGVGLIAVGAAIKNSTQKLKGFADGGLVFGPTIGLIGEGRGTNKSNPEVVAPLDKLAGFLRGSALANNVNVSGQFRVAGTDLVLALERTNQKMGRSF